KIHAARAIIKPLSPRQIIDLPSRLARPEQDPSAGLDFARARPSRVENSRCARVSNVATITGKIGRCSSPNTARSWCGSNLFQRILSWIAGKRQPGIDGADFAADSWSGTGGAKPAFLNLLWFRKGAG